MSEQTTFKQRILTAAEGVEKGEPLKDFLDDDEIECAISLLASVYLMSEEHQSENQPLTS
jgi:hypothetical protein